MPNASLTVDIDGALKKLTRVQKKQVPFATAHALTKTAQYAQRELHREIKRVFENPTRMTQNAVRVEPAKKTKLVARVHLKDAFGKGTPPSEYLLHHIEGGSREHKRFEKWLIARGIMSRGEFAVQGTGMPTNRFGNITPGWYAKILADIGQVKPGGHQKTKKRGRKRFYYSPNKRPRGIWVREGKRTYPALLFVQKTPQYRKRFKFYEIIQRSVDRRLQRQFLVSLAKAIRSAK